MNLSHVRTPKHFVSTLKANGVTSYLSIVCAQYLYSIYKVAHNQAFYRVKDVAEYASCTKPNASSALKQLKANGIIKTKVVGVGSGRKTLFEFTDLVTHEVTESVIPKVTESVIQPYKKDNSQATELSIQEFKDYRIGNPKVTESVTSKKVLLEDKNRSSNTYMSELSDESRTDARNTNEVQTSKETPQTDLTPKDKNPKKKKVARKKKDHPETDRLLDKLMTLFDQWNLPRKPKRDREAMRKLLTGKSLAQPETVNQLIDYLNWRGYDKELKQNLDGRHPNEIRAVSSFVSKFDKLHAEMEHARKLHSRKAQGNADRDQQIKEFVARQDYLYSEEGQAAVQQWRDEFADI